MEWYDEQTLYHGKVRRDKNKKYVWLDQNQNKHDDTSESMLKGKHEWVEEYR